MANYVLTTYVTDRQNTVAEAVALLEAQLETVNTTKTIRYIDVIRQGAMFTGIAIYDT